MENEVQTLLEAMSRYMEVSSEEKKARSEYQGYDWGYHGWHCTRRTEEARIDVIQAMRDAIAAGIKEQLSK